MGHQPPDQHADWGHPCAALWKRHGGTRHRRNNKGASTTLTGNTNVTVKDNAIVAGAIIGGSTSSHNAVTTITGNTSVLVTNIQHSNSATVNLGDFGNVTAQNFITGGSAWTANQTSGTTIQGNTSVTINVGDAELSGTEGHNNFVKNIYGGSYANTKSESNGAVQKWKETQASPSAEKKESPSRETSWAAPSGTGATARR